MLCQGTAIVYDSIRISLPSLCGIPGISTMCLFIAFMLWFAQIGTFICADTRATHCYGDLGCFQSHYEIPLPYSPATIATTFRLHVRNTSDVYNLTAYNLKSHISSWLTHFDASKQTKILIHGFKDTGVRPMWTELANELLKRVSYDKISIFAIVDVNRCLSTWTC